MVVLQRVLTVFEETDKNLFLKTCPNMCVDIFKSLSLGILAVSFSQGTWCDCDSPAMGGLERTCRVT